MTAPLSSDQAVEAIAPPRIGTWLLFVAPSLAAAGPLLPVVAPFYAFRVIAVALAAVTAIAFLRGRLAPDTRVAKAAAGCAVAWIVGGLAATMLAIDLREALSVWLAVICGWTIVLASMRLTPLEQGLGRLVDGWVVAFVVTSAIGTFEVLTQRHLDNYVLAPYLAQGRGEHLAASTFGNPNLFALFLAMGVPVLLYLVRRADRRRTRWTYVGLTLWAFVMVLYTGSRLGMLATIIGALVWALVARRAWFAATTWTVLTGLFVVVLLGFVGPPRGDVEGAAAPPVKLSETTAAEVTGRATEEANSGNLRVVLTQQGWDMVKESRGIGIGPGNFKAWLTENDRLAAVSGVASPHNAVTELAAEFGLLALVVTLALFLFVVVTVLRPGPPGASDDPHARVMVLGMAVGFPVYAFCNSTFWEAPTTWVALALLLLAAARVEVLRRTTHDARAERRHRVAGARTP